MSGITNQYGSQVGVNSPFGTVNYQQTGQLNVTDPNSGTVYNVPGYTENIGLSPTGQQLLGSTVGTQALAGQQAQNLLSGANYGGTPDTVGTATTGMTQDLINQNVSYMQPLQLQASQRLDTQLRNQGIMPGDPAYTNQMRDLQDQQARDTNQMIIGSQGTAYNEAQQNYLRPLQVAQGLYPLGTPTQPSQIQTPQGGYAQPATNVAGIVNNAYGNAMQGYQAQLGAYGAQNAMIGGLVSPLAKVFMGGIG